jgi:hypothetical protein
LKENLFERIDVVCSHAGSVITESAIKGQSCAAAPYHRPVFVHRSRAPRFQAFLHRLAKATVCCRSRSQRARRKTFCLSGRGIIRNNPKVRLTLSPALLKAIGVFKGLSNAAQRMQQKHSKPHEMRNV